MSKRKSRNRNRRARSQSRRKRRSNRKKRRAKKKRPTQKGRGRKRRRGGRKRSKNRRKKRRKRRRAERKRTADPYAMNQDHEQRPVEKYRTGGPSEWAEDPHPPMDDVGRDEIGLPEYSDMNLDHKDVDEWGSDAPYDNERTAREEKRRRAMEASLEKKAHQCIKIARQLLPQAGDDVIEEQALDLMSLADESVISTVLRLATDGSMLETENADQKDSSGAQSKTSEEDDEEMEEDDEEMEEDDEEMEEDDEEMEEDEAEEDEDEGDSKESSGEPQSAVSQLRDLVAAEEGGSSEDVQYDESDVAAAVAEEQPGFRDAENVEAVLQNLESEARSKQGGQEISLSPPMDTYDASMQQEDELLSKVMESKDIQQVNDRAANKRGVRSIGQVKEADSKGAESDLSKLWKKDPDVSDVFDG